MTNKQTLLHPPEYPEELETSKAKTMYWVLWHLRLIDIGRGKVIGKVTQLVPEMGWIFAGLAFFGVVQPKPINLLWLTLSGFGLVWLGGWIYTYFNIDKVEMVLQRYRDPMFKQMHKVVNNMVKDKKR